MTHLYFYKFAKLPNRKTVDYFVVNKSEEILGKVIFYNKWRQYVWEQKVDIVMSHDCLQEVVDFIKDKTVILYKNGDEK